MVEWYQPVLDLLNELYNLILMGLPYILASVIIVALTLVEVRLARRLFSRARESKRVPIELIKIVDASERVARYAIYFIGALLLTYIVTLALGVSEIVVNLYPYIVASALIVALTWIGVQAVKPLFELLRERRAIPLEVINTLELVSRYLIILIGLSLLVVDIAAAGGLGKEIVDAVVAWFTTNLFGFVFIAVLSIIGWIASKFYTVFFEDLKKRTTLHPRIVDMASAAVRYLTYALLGVMILMTVLSIAGFPEISPTITTMFAMFIGVSVSFAATSAIGNFIAGLILTNWKPFDIGDRVDVGSGVYGDVMDFDVLFTKIKTIKQEIISVPNLSVLSNKIMNYSSLRACVVHSRVAVAYDYDRRTVENLLLEAASMTEDILSEPKPYVLIPELANFYVVYEINAYTDKPNKLATIYSDLHKNILDIFDKAQITLYTPTIAVDSTILYGLRKMGGPTR